MYTYLHFKFKHSILLVILLVSANFAQGQVTIGSTDKPKAGALLDLTEGATTTKGLGLPRVALQDINVLQVGGINSDVDNAYNKHVGLVVYNTPADLSCPAINPGLYVWTGTVWQFVGTTIEPTDFIPNNPGTSTDPFGGANSYVMGHNQRIKIPVKRAYYIWNTYSSATNTPTNAEISQGKVLDIASVNNLTGTLSASIAWQEGANGESNGCVIAKNVRIEDQGEGASLVVESMTRKGNALVHVHIGNNGNNTDPVLWSWHIWIPDGDPTDAGALTYYNNAGTDNGINYVNTFMDRNLGAIDNVQRVYNVSNNETKSAYGLYYQWGRATPMPRIININKTLVEKTTNATDIKVKDNFIRAIQSPNFLRVSSATNLDWYCLVDDGSMNNLWTDRWGDHLTKSPLDPCPVGWRVPFSNPLGGNPNPWWNLEGAVSANSLPFNNGYNFVYGAVNIGYWSAGGIRSETSGNLAGQSITGFNWSVGMRNPGATKNPVWHLYFSDGLSNPDIMTFNLSPAARGNNVRCVKEY